MIKKSQWPGKRQLSSGENEGAELRISIFL
jgi:hypothetical protein